MGQNPEWFQDAIGDYDDDLLLLDCPGQIELFTGSGRPALARVAHELIQAGYNVCAVYLTDAQAVIDGPKFVSACMVAMSTMVSLELPHVNVR